MGSSWNTLPAEEFCTSVRDGTHDSPRPVENGKLLVTTRNLRKGHLDLESAYRISVEDFEAVNRRSKVDRWDVLISMIGTIGEVYLVDHEPEFAIKNIGLFKSQDELRGKWLYYYLCSPRVRGILEQHSRGTTQQYVPLGALRSLPVTYPTDPKELQRIVNILSRLDKKISLNRLLSSTLEEIAQTLFRAWFITFTARPSYGSSTPTQGQVPPPWPVGTIGDLVERRTQRIGNASATVLSAVAEGALVRSEDYFKKRVHSKSISKYLAVHQWDFAYNPSRINIGSIGLHEEPFVGAVSPVYIVARPKSEYRWFLRFLLLEESTKEWIKTLSTGSVRQSLTFDAFASIPCAIPPLRDIRVFNETWEKLRAAITVRQLESDTLSRIRDTLLPKLISGELSVSEAEQKVSEVAS